MFVLRTGLQGNGKTLNTIKEVDQKAANEGRVVYYHNIRGFNPNAEVLKAVWQPFDNPHQWHELPENSVIVIDEAQTFFRIRKSSEAVPPYASALETMRHRGHELHCITQAPGLIDHHFRKLCNSHIHYVRGHKGKVIKRWEFERVNNEVERKNSFSEGEATRILLDKNYFGVYQSVAVGAEHHMKFKPPRALYVFIGCALLLGAGAYYLYERRLKAPDEVAPAASESQGSAIVPQALATARGDTGDLEILSIEDYIALRTPRLADVPSSAPLYDNVAVAVTYPKLSCIYTDEPSLLERNSRFMQGRWQGKQQGCFCNTQQGTLASVSFAGCMNYAQNGAFDPAKPEPQAAQRSERTAGRGASGEPASAAPSSAGSRTAGSFGALSEPQALPLEAVFAAPQTQTH